MADMINVEPAKLRKIAEDIGIVYKTLHSNITTAKSQVDSLRGVWTGEAAEAFQVSYKALDAKCHQSLDKVFSMSNALYESADAYEKSEKAVKQDAMNMPKLPTNTIK